VRGKGGAAPGDGTAEELLERAAGEMRSRIRRDLRRVSAPLKPILGAIEAHLLASDFDVAWLKRRTALKSCYPQFVEELGQPPKEYLKDLLMEMGAWLLRSSGLPVWQVAQLLGYSQDRNFSRDFKAWSGDSPTRYRGASPRRGRHRPCPALTKEELALRWRALSGRLREDEAGDLLDAVATGGPSIELLGKVPAEGLCRRLGSLLGSVPSRQASRLLRGEIRCRTPELFHLLGEKSIEEGRRDRRRGVELARLALDSLELGRDHLGEVAGALLALGWARLGNAHRLATDPTAAGRAFDRADQHWSTTPEPRDPQIESEIRSLEASFRFFLGDHDRALHLIDRSITLSRQLGQKRRLVISLIQRGSVIGDQNGFLAAIPDHHEALELLKDLDEPYLELITHQNLTIIYALQRRFPDAYRTLAKAQRLCGRVDHPTIRHQLELVEGMLHRGQGELEAAEESFLRARDGFVKEKLPRHRAFLSLELALLTYQTQRFSEALRHATEALPVFEELQIHREAQIASDLLRKAVVADRLTLAVLQKARRAMRNLLRRPQGF